MLLSGVHRVEAAGIEPASRDISAMASTCVAELLSFAYPAPTRQGAEKASPELGLIPGVPDSDPRRSGIGSRLLGLSGEDPQSGLRVFTQPVRDCSRQLNLMVGF